MHLGKTLYLINGIHNYVMDLLIISLFKKIVILFVWKLSEKLWSHFGSENYCAQNAGQYLLWLLINFTKCMQSLYALLLFTHCPLFSKLFIHQFWSKNFLNLKKVKFYTLCAQFCFLNSFRWPTVDRQIPRH